jgi:hypothetical protein
VNVVAESTLLAANIGQGSITPYGTLPASNAALIKVAAATGGEVRTVLIVDTQLTSDPPVEVFMANDVN